MRIPFVLAALLFTIYSANAQTTFTLRSGALVTCSDAAETLAILERAQADDESMRLRSRYPDSGLDNRISLRARDIQGTRNVQRECAKPPPTPSLATTSQSAQRQPVSQTVTSSRGAQTSCATTPNAGYLTITIHRDNKECAEKPSPLLGQPSQPSQRNLPVTAQAQNVDMQVEFIRVTSTDARFGTVEDLLVVAGSSQTISNNRSALFSHLRGEDMYWRNGLARTSPGATCSGDQWVFVVDINTDVATENALSGRTGGKDVSTAKAGGGCRPTLRAAVAASRSNCAEGHLRSGTGGNWGCTYVFIGKPDPSTSPLPRFGGGMNNRPWRAFFSRRSFVCDGFSAIGGQERIESCLQRIESSPE